ncbi:hypothetical protein GCM10009721_06280 [Terrabacter tumescens]|uniref:Uncharacterized protein n=1 Tax=Terrabacter tumescens TaxID=60443 RepID=A0ABQ2HK77_9MICO|nr:hypothetical protein [Terrabacter tumescens]GGM84273.1 hypothetical protein GCM10009721_06280 [Terrabacter tumescens]
MTTPTSTRQTALGLFGVLVVLATSADTLPAVAPGTRPAAPVLTSVPADPTSSVTNTATWTHPRPGTRFRCSTDDRGWFPCTSPLTWALDPTRAGRHRLSVLAVGPSGRESTAVTYSFSYRDALRASGLRFTVTGGVGDLTPGVWRQVPVRVTNPGPVAVRVTALELHLPADSTPPGCKAATNLEVRQPRLAGPDALVVPARSTVTLPAPGVATAAIRLRDLATVNQDACKSKSFALTWSGTARQ